VVLDPGQRVLVVKPGERGFVPFPPDAEESRTAAAKASATGLAYSVPTATRFGLTDADAAAWVDRRRRDPTG
jgi:hypothetical protein